MKVEDVNLFFLSGQENPGSWKVASPLEIKLADARKEKPSGSGDSQVAVRLEIGAVIKTSYDASG